MIIAQITGVGTVGKNQRKIHPVASRGQVNICKVFLHTCVESVVSVIVSKTDFSASLLYPIFRNWLGVVRLSVIKSHN